MAWHWHRNQPKLPTVTCGSACPSVPVPVLVQTPKAEERSGDDDHRSAERQNQQNPRFSPGPRGDDPRCDITNSRFSQALTGRSPNIMDTTRVRRDEFKIFLCSVNIPRRWTGYIIRIGQERKFEARGTRKMDKNLEMRQNLEEASKRRRRRRQEGQQQQNKQTSKFNSFFSFARADPTVKTLRGESEPILEARQERATFKRDNWKTCC